MFDAFPKICTPGNIWKLQIIFEKYIYLTTSIWSYSNTLTQGGDFKVHLAQTSDTIGSRADQ